MEPRDAATVILVRDGVAGLEVLMLRRRLDSGFVPGAYVFPGGAVDPADRHDDVLGLCEGLSERAASELLGGRRSDPALAFWVAAIRECFEEAGVLLARDRNGVLVRLDDPRHRSRFLDHRRALDEGRRSLVEVCRDEGLRLAVGTMRYWGRWVTPVGAPRRYDTHFLLAAAPESQTPTYDDRETIGDLWITPTEALARHERGHFELILPTEATLRALTSFGRVADLLDAADRAQGVDGAQGDGVGPDLVDDQGGMRIRLWAAAAETAEAGG